MTASARRRCSSWSGSSPRASTDLRVGASPAEVADVPHVGAAPAVDRLVVVADDDAEVARAGGELLQQPVLDRVRVLELVDEDVVVLLLERLLRAEDLEADGAVALRLEHAHHGEG